MTTPVTYNHVQTATSILTRIAFSQGEQADPVAVLQAWRTSEGFDEDALERSARESASDSIQEIEDAIERGETFSTAQLAEYLEREYLTGLQVGWIMRARADAARADAPKAAE